MIHTGSNRMISLEPLTKNRDLDQGSTDRKLGPRGPRDPVRTRTSEIYEKADQKGPRTSNFSKTRTGADRGPTT